MLLQRAFTYFVDKLERQAKCRPAHAAPVQLGGPWSHSTFRISGENFLLLVCESLFRLVLLFLEYFWCHFFTQCSDWKHLRARAPWWEVESADLASDLMDILLPSVLLSEQGCLKQTEALRLKLKRCMKKSSALSTCKRFACKFTLTYLTRAGVHTQAFALLARRSSAHYMRTRRELEGSASSPLLDEEWDRKKLWSCSARSESMYFWLQGRITGSQGFSHPISSFL